MTVRAVAAERDAAHIAAMKRAYANTNVHKIELVTTMPFHTAVKVVTKLTQRAN